MTRSTTLLAGHVLALLTLISLALGIEAVASQEKLQQQFQQIEADRHLTASNSQPRRRLSEASDPASIAANAQNVNRCKIYSNDGKCQYCIRDSFLNSTSGVCQDIPYSKLIANCNVYSTQTACYQCDSNYYLNSTGACVANSLSNCAIQSDAQVCKTCAKGSFLANGLCTAPIANCDVASSAQACGTCSMGYYLLNSVCSQVPSTSAISNCQTYAVSGTTFKCASCAKGYALDTDGLTCWSKSQVGGQIDSNCENTVVNTGQYCQVCRQGYYLANNVCVKIPDDNVEGCFIANWSNPSLCLVCMPGFQITTANKCQYFGSETRSSQQDPLASTYINNALVVAVVGLLLLTN